MIAAYGEDTGDGHVRIPLSQAELNAREGHHRNSGVVGGYLRDLGPAVVARRPALVLGLHALEEPPSDSREVSHIVSLVDRLATLQDQFLALVSELLALRDPRNPRNPREDSSADAADSSRKKEQKASSVTLASCSSSAGSAVRGPRIPRTGGPDWSAEELDALVEELERLVRQAQKDGKRKRDEGALERNFAEIIELTYKGARAATERSRADAIRL